MPTVPTYKICPGRRIEVVVETGDGGRALVVGTLDRVPESMSGGIALQLVIAAERVLALPAAAAG